MRREQHIVAHEKEIAGRAFTDLAAADQDGFRRALVERLLTQQYVRNSEVVLRWQYSQRMSSSVIAATPSRMMSCDTGSSGEVMAKTVGRTPAGRRDRARRRRE